ncbi:hypothetical protein BgiBS90_022459 [Biomphalaria glabrata]|nr:hypothetical protein BgiBS90_022459 [Biomphalaria glabrata]
MCEEMDSMGNKVDKMVSQLKEGVDSLVKEQLPVDSLVKKLRGQDCGCTNSGDGDAGDLSAVCDCVVGKSLVVVTFKTRNVMAIAVMISTGCTESNGRRQMKKLKSVMCLKRLFLLYLLPVSQ